MLLSTLEQTQQLATALAKAVPEGSIVLLTGPMGVGKTTLVRYWAQALGYTGEVTSPTYTLIHEYPTPQGLLVHIDAYRMANQEELFGLGLEDYLPEAKVVLIEWGQAALFAPCYELQLTPQENGRSWQWLVHGSLALPSIKL